MALPIRRVDGTLTYNENTGELIERGDPGAQQAQYISKDGNVLFDERGERLDSMGHPTGTFTNINDLDFFSERFAPLAGGNVSASGASTGGNVSASGASTRGQAPPASAASGGAGGAPSQGRGRSGPTPTPGRPSPARADSLGGAISEYRGGASASEPATVRPGVRPYAYFKSPTGRWLVVPKGDMTGFTIQKDAQGNQWVDGDPPTEEGRVGLHRAGERADYGPQRGPQQGPQPAREGVWNGSPLTAPPTVRPATGPQQGPVTPGQARTQELSSFGQRFAPAVAPSAPAPGNAWNGGPMPGTNVAPPANAAPPAVAGGDPQWDGYRTRQLEASEINNTLAGGPFIPPTSFDPEHNWTGFGEWEGQGGAAMSGGWLAGSTPTNTAPPAGAAPPVVGGGGPGWDGYRTRQLETSEINNTLAGGPFIPPTSFDPEHNWTGFGEGQGGAPTAGVYPHAPFDRVDWNNPAQQAMMQPTARPGLPMQIPYNPNAQWGGGW